MTNELAELQRNPAANSEKKVEGPEPAQGNSSDALLSQARSETYGPKVRTKLGSAGGDRQVAAKSGDTSKLANEDLIIDDPTLKDLNDPKINKSQSSDLGPDGKPLADRGVENVKDIQLRKGHKPGDKPANYIIDKDGNVHQLRSPDKALGAGDEAVIVEIDDSEGQAAREATEKQRSAAASLIAAIESQFAAANRSPEIPADLLEALYAPANIPAPRVVKRGGGGGGSAGWGGGGGNMGGNRSFFNPGRAPSVPRGGGDGGGSSISGPRDVSGNTGKSYDFSSLGGLDKNNPVDRVVSLISANEGKPSSINWNDNGHGISVGMFQANQKSGELPMLLKKMHESNPQLFNQVFKEHAADMLNERFVRSAHFSKNNELGRMMQEAVNQPDFQKVQLNMIREKVAHASDVAKQYGVESTLGVAIFADLINQCGEGGAKPYFRAALSRGNEQDKIRAVVNASQSNPYRGDRAQKIARSGLVSANETFNV